MAIKKLVSEYYGYIREQIDLGESEDILPLVESASKQAKIEPIPLPMDLWDCLDEEFHKYEIWLYQDSIYGLSGSYSKDHKRLLILEAADQERQKFERLKAKFSGEQTKGIRHERERIPEDVRVAVWRRDQGKCVSCLGRERLEYDHIVAVSRGGGNTTRNIELLCETCNRAKGDRIQ
ncbi:MAG: HNH endonuclease [Janthinobacterium lividum]